MTTGDDRLVSGRYRTIATVVVLAAFFMDLLDSTIVNVAIPTLQHNLHATYEAVQWITAGYSLTYALFLINGGRLGDMFGYKRLFLIGVVGFTICSLMSGLAPNPTFLIISRCLQGTMAAVMVPQVLSTIQLLYTPQERGGISGLYGAIGGLASVLGPILGALLIQLDAFHLYWRTIFLINVIVGAIAVPVALKVLPTGRSTHPPALDLVGSILLILGMLLLIFPLIQGRADGWPIWMFASMICSVPVFVLFGWIERGRDAKRRALVATHLFRTRAFPVGLVINMVFFGALVSFLLMFTLFLQIGDAFPVLRAGVTTIPFSIGVALSAGVSGTRLRPIMGRYVITLGCGVLAAGLGYVYSTAANFGTGLTPWEMVPALLVTGIGMGMVVAPLVPFVLSKVPLRDAGSASGLLSAFGQVGAAAGIAVIGLLFFSALTADVDASVATVVPQLEGQLTADHVPARVQNLLVSTFSQCFHDESADPGGALPATCQASSGETHTQSGAEIATALAEAARQGVYTDFLDGFHAGIIAAIAAMILCLLLTFFLPEQVEYSQQEPVV